MDSKKLTRREFLTGMAALAAVPDLPETKEAPEIPVSNRVVNVQVLARIPSRASVVDPATLTEYIERMEFELSERMEWIKEWSTWKVGPDTPSLKEMLQGEIYALLDSLAMFIAAVERVGCGEVAKEVLLTDDAINYAQVVNSPATYFGQEENNAELIKNHLWGQRPPAMSPELRRFAVLKTIISEAIVSQMGW